MMSVIVVAVSLEYQMSEMNHVMFNSIMFDWAGCVRLQHLCRCIVAGAHVLLVGKRLLTSIIKHTVALIQRMCVQYCMITNGNIPGYRAWTVCNLSTSRKVWLDLCYGISINKCIYVLQLKD